MDPAERPRHIEMYKAGPSVLRTAWNSTPVSARNWRPAPGEWSATEIIAHCADAELVAAARIRLLIAEPDPIIAGFDQAAWAVTFDYQSIPTDLAFAVIEATRAHTSVLLDSLTEHDWQQTGTHTHTGRISVDDWLAVYGEHLHIHARQIEANVRAWKRQAGISS